VLDAPIAFDEGVPTPSTAVPSPVPTFETSDEITNVLLLGNDVPLETEGARTDTMIIVSINNEEQTASMISLPRDLYVYHPGKIMNRLNAAMSLGGVEQMQQTILYNFGIPIHYYARIDFEGFQQVVDAMGGIDLAVSCRLQDWRLISPELDPQLEENWHQFALEPGVHHMDGDTALWYARSRLSSSDFDRGRRQQQLLHAMFNQGVDLNLIAEAPALWETYRDAVDTDLDIGRLLQFATLAPAIRENGVQHLYLVNGMVPWTTTDGANVQLPIWDGEGNFGETFSRLYQPPTLKRATRPAVTVEIINASGNPDMALLAADNLAWYGFIPIISEETPSTETTTRLEFYHPTFKDAYEWLISWIVDMRRSEIELVEDAAYEYDYRLILGEDYDPCLNQLRQPQEFLDQ
jgi:LCP family protein required for cell wall assembly